MERVRQGVIGLPPLSRPNQGRFGDKIGEIARCCSSEAQVMLIYFLALPTICAKALALGSIYDGSDPAEQMSIYER